MLKLLMSKELLLSADASVKKQNIARATAIFFLIYSICVLSTILLNALFILFALLNGELHNIISENGSINLLSFFQWSEISSLFSRIGFIFVCIIFCTKIEKRPIFTLGFNKKNIVGEYGKGMFWGLLVFSSAYLLMLLCGQIEFMGFAPTISPFMVFIFFIGYIIQGMSEEVLLRGYCLVSFACHKNLRFGIIFNSLVFSLLHLGNSGITVIALINLFLFGIFASIYFIKKRNIWGISAIHTMWNFAQGNIFGCAVSGSTKGTTIFNSYKNEGLSMLNGGDFGPEGSIFVTLILLLGIGGLLLVNNKEKQESV